MNATALWYDRPGSAVLRDEVLEYPDALQSSSHALVRTCWSAISRGTERLVISGKVPPSEYGRMRSPFQCGDFPFPVKYGYCAAGVIEAGPAEMLGRNVFALHPHQDRFWLPVGQLALIPDSVPLRRATLAANMETALNAVWDSGAGPGDNIIVIGAGVVGLLITALCAALPGADVTAVDSLPDRAQVAAGFGAQFLTPDELGQKMQETVGGSRADIVFHTTATDQGLGAAIAVAGFEGRVVEVSWYGDRLVNIPLGGAFHSQRLQLISSQVGHVSPLRRARWSYNRRISKAMELLRDNRLDALITSEFAFENLPHALPDYLGGPSSGLAAVVRY